MPDQLKTIRKTTVIGAVINLLLTVIKITIGLLSGSMALVADGVHSLSDLATDAAIWIGVQYWSAPPDKTHPYGHGRYETMVNLLIAGVLGLAGTGIGWRAVFAIFSGAPQSNPQWSVFYVALISVAVKEALFRWTLARNRTICSSALATNAWHHRSDALSSLPVAAAVIGEFIYPDFHYYDEIAAIAVTIMLLRATWQLAKPSVYELFEAAPDLQLNARISNIAADIDNIVNVHSVRCRKLGGQILVDMHMDINPNMTVYDSHKLTLELHARIITEIPEITETLIHVEPYGEKNEWDSYKRHRNRASFMDADTPSCKSTFKN